MYKQQNGEKQLMVGNHDIPSRYGSGSTVWAASRRPEPARTIFAVASSGTVAAVAKAIVKAMVVETISNRSLAARSSIYGNGIREFTLPFVSVHDVTVAISISVSQIVSNRVQR
ncbi:hypothetical protein Ancab_039429 [Ancistrocladus abbreviatus]